MVTKTIHQTIDQYQCYQLYQSFLKNTNLHLHSHLSKIKFLHEYQCGFREGFSCSFAVQTIVSDCLEFKMKNEKISMMFMDFSKAYDCVNHNILSKRLEVAGINGKALGLLNSFLNERSQKVLYIGEESSILPINIGVPQGSIIAPTLFLIYINNLLKLPLFASFFAYADDTVFINHDRKQII